VQQLDEIEQAREKGELHEEEAEELEGKVIEQQVGGAPTTEPEEDAQSG
jgi:hypothetical protein